MKRQIVPKTLVVVVVGGSSYITIHLLSIYIAAVADRLVGAGAAQWQFAFIWAIPSAALALAGALTGYFVKPRLSRWFLGAALVALVVPLALFALVVLHVY